MFMMYINSQKYGLNHVKIRDKNKDLYQGRCGTIPVQSEEEYLEVEIRNSSYEKQKQQKSWVSLIGLFIISFFNPILTQGFGVPHYYKLKVQKHLFMQLQYDNTQHLFKSNVAIEQQKIKDKDYMLFWMISYILPLQCLTLVCVLIAFLFMRSMVLVFSFGFIALISQLNIFYQLYKVHLHNR